MCSSLQSISYVKDSEKLLKGRLVKPKDTPLIYTLFLLFKRNY